MPEDSTQVFDLLCFFVNFHRC